MNRISRLRAPELAGRGWLNTGGAELSLADLRGRIVVLDFWTFCCVNCLHVLDELRPLEEKYADSLVLIGVHSPKFEHEADPDALVAAVERYAVHHPVLDDPDLVTWQAYTARAWPTLVVIDPEGYIVASMSGEGHAHGLSVLVEELIAEHSAKGTLRQGDSPYAAPEPAETALRFPGKVAALPDGSFVVSDTTHHEIVWLEPDLVTERRRFSGTSGTSGTADGNDELAEPQGVLVLPSATAERVGYDVVVADSVHHQVKGLRLSDGTWTVLAGTGEQLRERSGSGPALKQALSTPWDLAWFIDRVVIAMAGVHQLWALHLATDPADNTVAVLGGTSAEGLRDGAADEAWFAQPSGLAVSADGSRLWVADSETSALRSLDVTDEGFVVTTHIGQGLFDFGHRDGAADQALLQHPLGVTVLPDGSVAISDTYNGAIRRFDPVTSRGQHPGQRTARALRRGRRDLRRRRGWFDVDAAAGRRVGGPPARAGAAAGQGNPGRRPGPADAAPPHQHRAGRRTTRGHLHPADRAEARPPLGRPDAAHGLGDPRAPAALRWWQRPGPDPGARPRPRGG